MIEYDKAVEYLYSIPMFTKDGAASYKPGYDRIETFDRIMNHPHKGYKTIHVAGTNGKGSTSSMIASVLMEAGYKVGLYTSPHLFDFRERIRVDGQMIPRECVVEYVEKLQGMVKEISASFFETVTAMAFDYFQQQGVDYAVIETGLGGLKDATNIISPCATLITNIGYDHTDILGHTLGEIAFQKGGIIKEGVPLVIGEYDSQSSPVLEQIATEKGAPYVIASKRYNIENRGCGNFTLCCDGNKVEIESPLVGDYQGANIASVISLFDIIEQNGVLGVDIPTVAKGIANCVTNSGIMGRWQQLGQQPLVICDTGHNVHGLRAIFENIKRLYSDKRVIAVMGFAGDKNIEAMMSIFPKEIYYIFTQAKGPRAAKSSTLSSMARGYGIECEDGQSVATAISRAVEVAEKEDVIFIGGSNFVVGEIDIYFFNN